MISNFKYSKLFFLLGLVCFLMPQYLLAQEKVEKDESRCSRVWDGVERVYVNTIVYKVCNQYDYIYVTKTGTQKKSFTKNDERVEYYSGDEKYVVYVELYKTATWNDEKSVCDSYTWNYSAGKSETYTTQGTNIYTKTLQNAVGGFCDSVKTLKLTIRKSNNTNFNPGPQCDEYYWPAKNHTYTETTTDNVKFTNKAGCDSMVTLSLVVNKSSKVDIPVEACDSYKWNGTTYRDSDEPVVHNLNKAGCDSTTTLHLTIYKSNAISLNVIECDSYTWDPFNRTYTSSIVDEVKLSNIHGCDSIVTLNLTIRNSSASTISESIIQKQLPYTFNGHTYTSLDGTVNEQIVVRNAVGCDSVITYTLKVFPNVSATADSVVCQNVLESQSGFRWNGRSFTSEGSQVVVLTSKSGSDSTLVMNVTSYPSYTSQLYEDICDNGSYSFYGTICKQPTVYKKTFKTIHGCDSVIVLNLSVHPTYRHTISQTICNNNPYRFCDEYHDVSKTVTCTSLRSIYNCDSIVTLNLVAHDTTTSEVFDTIVQNELPYTYHNLKFTKNDVEGTGSGSMIARIAKGNKQKCDSVITYHLKVYKNDTVNLDSTICANLLNTFTWNGKTFKSNLYQEVKLPTTNMADSVIRMTVSTTPNPSRTIFDTIAENLLPITIYKGTPYEKMFNDAVSNYKFNVATSGCDSIITYNLFVRQNSTMTIDTAVCADALAAGYDWRGYHFTGVGRQFKTVPQADGTDLIIAYVMNERPLYDNHVTKVICSNQKYDFAGEKISAAGEYVDNNQSVYGCDSVTTLTLVVNAVTYGAQYDTVVENRYNDRHTVGWYSYRYGWYYQGEYYRQDVEHRTVVIRNVKNCDSIIDYNLYAYKNVDTTLYDTICGDLLPYTWDEGEYALTFKASDFSGSPKQGTSALTYKRLTTHGADSTIYLRLTVRPSWHSNETRMECEQRMLEDYEWLDTVFRPGTVSGDYTLSRVSMYNCDSTHTLHLSINASSEETVYDTIVENQTKAVEGYVYNDVHFYTTDTIVNQQIVIKNVKGCDSTIYYNLLVYKNVTGEDDTIICADQLPWTWNNALFEEDSLAEEVVEGKSRSGVVVMKGTILAHTGADSVITMTVAVNPVYDYHYFDTICDDTSTFFMGTEYWKEGTDVRHLSSSLQCDSAWTFHLTVYPVYEFDYYDTIYQDEWSYFGGWAYNKAGAYTDTLLTVNNCDSIQTLNLVVNWRIRVDSSICNNFLPFRWNDRVFNRAAKDSTHLRSSEGLDSLVIMTVSVRDTTFSYEYKEECDQYTWRNNVTYYDTSYTDTIKFINKANCDSVIHLTLIMHYSTPDTHYHHECNNYTWLNGITYDSSIFGPQFMLRTIYGCDSLVTLDLHLDYDTYDEELDSICHGEVLNWRGYSLYKGDTYYDSLLTVKGCDSITALFLTELPSIDADFELSTDCFVKEHKLSLSSSVGYVKWSAVPADETLFGQEHNGTVVVAPKQSTTYTIYADYRKEPLCPVTKSIMLERVINPTALLRTAPEYLTYDDIHLQAIDLNEQDFERNWYINGYNIGEHDAILDYDINPGFDTIKVMLEVMSEYCSDTAYASVPVLKPVIFVPNAFTPGLQSNNRFFAKGDEIHEFEMFIYNRRGQLLFHTRDINDSWDGRFDGEDCPQGVYVYRIRYSTSIIDNSWQTVTGSVTLIR